MQCEGPESTENCKTWEHSRLILRLPKDTRRPESGFLTPKEEQKGPAIGPTEPLPGKERETSWPRQPYPRARPEPRACAAPGRAVRHLPSRVRSPAPQRRGEQRDPAPPAPPRPEPGPRGLPRT